VYSDARQFGDKKVAWDVKKVSRNFWGFLQGNTRLGAESGGGGERSVNLVIWRGYQKVS